jgi:hypothetical protein
MCCLAHGQLLQWVQTEMRAVSTTPNIHVYSTHSTKIPALMLVYWNIKTIMIGLVLDLKAISDLRKTVTINRELHLQVGIAALQVTHLGDSGSVRCRYNFTASSSKVTLIEVREHGVVFTLDFAK